MIPSLKVPTGLARLLVWCSALLALAASYSDPAGAFPVKSWYEMRWEGVHRQETDESCGPASVVTLLETYFEVDVDEPEVFTLATAYLDDLEREVARALRAGTSLRGLQDAMNHLGFRSVGVRIAYDDLLRYFDEVGMPMIAHFDLPEKHFVVIAGKLESGSILVADPSRGRYVLSRAEALARFSGHALLYEPPRPVDEGLVERQLQEAERFERFARRLAGASREWGA